MASDRSLSIEEQEVAGYKLELFVINFVKDKMTCGFRPRKIAAVGMRKLAEPPIVKRALETLKGRARIKRTMWSRRAQNMKQKINSGNIVGYFRSGPTNLFRSDTQPSSPTASANSTKRHSIGCRARFRRCSALRRQRP